MGVIILILCVILLGGTIAYTATKEEQYKFSEACCCAITLSIIASVVLIIAVAASYRSYLDLKRDRVAIQQHERAINLYLSKAKLEMDSNVITDLKYNKYQNNLAKLIRDYRDCVNKYNNNLISKREMNNNFMFNLLVIGPDPDMREIEINPGPIG